VRQLEKSRASAPPVQINAPAAAVPKTPEPATPEPAAPEPAAPATGTTYDPNKSVADKQAKGQADQQLATQQMKTTADANAAKSKEDSAIKAAADAAKAKPGFQQTAADKLAIKNAADKGIREDQEADTVSPTGAKPAASTPGQQTMSAVDAFKQRKDNVYLNALKQFVQKNLLGGLPYTRLQNADVIDSLITNMSKPENAAPATQLPMWQQLVQQAVVADVLPASLSGGPAQDPQAKGTTGKETPQELQQPVAQVTGKEAGADPSVLAKVGEVLRQRFTNNETDIGSTGDPAVDALLLNMGFKP
jgi:hypothetical protein